MQRAHIILSILSKKSVEDNGFIFTRLYRNLFNLSFYTYAHKKIYTNREKPFNQEIISKVIKDMKSEKYYPKSVAGSQPQSFVDILVQEIMKEILVAIYNPILRRIDQGPYKHNNFHVALYGVKKNFSKVNWVVKGKIKGFQSTDSYKILIDILKTKIKDGRFLELIRRFINAGYFRFSQETDILSGSCYDVNTRETIGSILTDIYLHELDKHIRGHQKLKDENIKYVGLEYVRYGDNFIAGISGAKGMALKMKEEIENFLFEKLGLDLDLEQSIIRNINYNKLRFLGYDIVKSRKNRILYEDIILLMPGEVLNQKLKPFKRGGKGICYNSRVNLPVLELLRKYNSEIEGLYNYYCLASDVSFKLNKFKYFHYQSLVKTIARKERCSVKSVMEKYGVNINSETKTGTKKIVGVNYPSTDCTNGIKTILYFNKKLKANTKPIITVNKDLRTYT